MDLPIQKLPNTTPPKFEYHQTVGMPGTGEKRKIKCEGMVPSPIEEPLCQLIDIAIRLENVNADLKRENDRLREEIGKLREQAEKKKGK
jgi:hypothetical protein